MFSRAILLSSVSYSSSACHRTVIVCKYSLRMRCLVLLLSLLHFCKDVTHHERPQNVILFLADGGGPAALALSRSVRNGPLVLDQYLTGAVRTASANSQVTDSAAAATAYSCGFRTNNEVVGMGPTGQACRSLSTELSRRGYFTAVLTNTRLTHATPAAFTASVPRRDDEAAIALQQIHSAVHLLAGGGRQQFLPVAGGGLRKDGKDVLAQARQNGWRVLSGLQDFARPGGKDLIFLGDDHLSYAIDRPVGEISYADWTEQIIKKVLELNKPFFLLIEAGRIDHAAHRNDAAAMAKEVLEFDEAFSRAVALTRLEGQTLVLATADHETGGLSLGRMKDGLAVYGYSPEVLRRIRSSTRVMAETIHGGSSCALTMREAAGIQLGLSEIQRCAQEKHPEPLALLLAAIISEKAGIAWSTTGHTGVDVGLFAAGPGRQIFQGTLDNRELRGRILEVLGL